MKKQIKIRSPAGEWAKTYTRAFEDGKKQILEEELKFLKKIVNGTSYCWMNNKIDERIEQIKKEMKDGNNN